MDCKDFVQRTVCGLKQPELEQLKNWVIGRFVSFSVIQQEAVTAQILAEKICDYFEKVFLKTGKDFDRQIESYMYDLDSVIGPGIARTSQGKKADNTQPSAPRARKYYEKAVSFKNPKGLTFEKLHDYSRIMFCLYAAEIEAKEKPISDFDFSGASLNPERIIKALLSEEVNIVFPPSKKRRFYIREIYSSDSSTIMLAVLMITYILNGLPQGEKRHG